MYFTCAKISRFVGTTKTCSFVKRQFHNSQCLKRAQTDPLNMTTPNLSRVEKKRERFYQIEGTDELYPSVTTILQTIHKPDLEKWTDRMARQHFETEIHKQKERIITHPQEAKGLILKILLDAGSQPDKVREEFGEFGTRMHDLIDRVVLGKEIPSIPEEAKPVIDGFSQWKKQNNYHFISGDTMLYSKTNQYAGAADAIARNKDGKLVVFDWKTSSIIHTTYAMQVAAYAKALEEMTSETVAEAHVVRFDRKTGEFEHKRVADIEQSFQAFKMCLTLWGLLKQKDYFVNEKGSKDEYMFNE